MRNRNSRGLTDVFVIAVALANILFNYFVLFQFEQSSMILRSLDLSCVLLAVISLPRLLQAIVYRREYAIEHFLAVFACIGIAGTLITFTQYPIAVIERERILRFFVRMVEVFFLGFVIKIHLRKELINKVIWYILILCLFLSLGSVYVNFMNPGEYTRIGSIFLSGTAADGFGAAAQANFNELGALFATLFVICIGRVGKKEVGLKGKLVLAGISFVYFAAVLLTTSRSAFVGAVIGIAVCAVIQRGRARVAGLVLAGLVGFFIFTKTSVAENMIGRFSETFTEGSFDNVGAMTRLDSIRSAWNVFLEHPLLGVGYSGFRNFSEEGFITPENYYMELLADTGIAGALVWLLYLGSLGRKLWFLKFSPSSGENNLAVDIFPGLVCLLATNLTGNNLMDPSLMILFLTLCACIEVEYSYFKTQPSPASIIKSRVAVA